MIRHHPVLSIQEQNVREARGERLEALGAFDPALTGSASVIPRGPYEYGYGGVALEQPTPFWGSRWYVGWGGLWGRNPPYVGPVPLGEAGELRAGVLLPLWLNGPIDPARARIRGARFGITAAEQALRAQALILSGEAARAYWSWVAAGLRYRIARSLLELAEVRDDQVRRMVQAGALAEIDLLENRRSILLRERMVLDAQRLLEQRAIELSLYYRNGRGVPFVPTPAQVPAGMAELAGPTPDVDEGVRLALERRPEFERYEALLERIAVDVELAESRFAPRVDATLDAALGLGDRQERLPGTTRTRVEGGVYVSIPLLFRGARGGIDRLEARAEALRAEALWLRERITAEVQNAHSALRVAIDRVTIARAGAQVATRVADAERRRLRLGETDLFVVNLREEAAAEAQAAEVDAEAELRIADAIFRATVGDLPGLEPGRGVP